ncbi:MAG: hypothetical protein KKE30_06200 [Gammaproteobacteria bacterium]|nr:hypothetical protein [Gammaproteobacteria bacterium]MBU1553559.1 hypothetical protein [Gammaproteobacteria bacterium]MBU2069974.1 hypothetical protein [Gammaproteobacteria bacterium]MBU2185119.1 hypothetical protein [Gammaproteobacteria bacterium]MBU2206987.1 hypothetical protein [Gammaproteobacteria bacterium]
MQKTKLAVNWIEDKQPTQQGMYFTAQRYPTGFGVYDIVAWDGEQWQLDASINVVGWIAFEDFLKNLDISWPISDQRADAAFKARYEADKDNFKPDDFVEVE